MSGAEAAKRLLRPGPQSTLRTDRNTTTASDGLCHRAAFTGIFVTTTDCGLELGGANAWNSDGAPVTCLACLGGEIDLTNAVAAAKAQQLLRAFDTTFPDAAAWMKRFTQ